MPTKRRYTWNVEYFLVASRLSGHYGLPLPTIILIGIIDCSEFIFMTLRQKTLAWLYPVLMKWRQLVTKPGFLAPDKPVMPAHNIFNLQVELIDGTHVRLETFKGKKLLVVNTASDCGYTAQYGQLQELYTRFREQVVVIAFPSNDFREQEKGTNDEIISFCQANFGVTFPVVKKSQVKRGSGQHPVFDWLTHSEMNGWCNQQPRWNFCKYLINEQGQLVYFADTSVSPLDPQMLKCIKEPNQSANHESD